MNQRAIFMKRIGRGRSADNSIITLWYFEDGNEKWMEILEQGASDAIRIDLDPKIEIKIKK